MGTRRDAASLGRFERGAGTGGSRCHYDVAFRPFSLPGVRPLINPGEPAPDQRRRPIARKHVAECGSARDEGGSSSGVSDDTPRSVATPLDTNANSDDERADDLIFWFPDGELWKTKKTR